jgi:hypothetical protein
MGLLMGVNMLGKFIFLLYFFLILFHGYAQEQEQNHDETNTINLDYRESFRINTYRMPTRVDSIFQKMEISSDAKKKIDYLLYRGYIQVDNYNEYLYNESIYKMVYLAFPAPNGYLSSEFEENGIKYVLIYRDHEGKQHDTNPNFYTVVTVVDNDLRFKFIKINFFLEYYIEEKWQYKDSGKFYIEKIFY